MRRATLFLSTIAASAGERTMIKTVNNVAIVPMFDNNYGYILIDKLTNSAALVDPAEPAPIKKACDDLNLNVKMILNTHKHDDHTGGNLDLKAAYEDMHIYGPSKDGPIPGMTTQVDAGTYIFKYKSHQCIN